MIALKPGAVTLAELRAVWNGAPVSLHADAWSAIRGHLERDPNRTYR